MKSLKDAQLKFPGIIKPPSYKAFLMTFLEHQPNQRAFVLMDKDTFDAEYNKGLKSFDNDEAACRRYMDEVSRQRAAMTARIAVLIEH